MGRSAVIPDLAKVRCLFFGRRKWEPYERMARAYKREQLVTLCQVRQIDYDPKATKLQLALLLTGQ